MRSSSVYEIVLERRYAQWTSNQTCSSLRYTLLKRVLSCPSSSRASTAAPLSNRHHQLNEEVHQISHARVTDSSGCRFSCREPSQSQRSSRSKPQQDALRSSSASCPDIVLIWSTSPYSPIEGLLQGVEYATSMLSRIDPLGFRVCVGAAVVRFPGVSLASNLSCSSFGAMVLLFKIQKFRQRRM